MTKAVILFYISLIILITFIVYAVTKSIALVIFPIIAVIFVLALYYKMWKEEEEKPTRAKLLQNLIEQLQKSFNQYNDIIEGLLDTAAKLIPREKLTQEEQNILDSTGASIRKAKHSLIQRKLVEAGLKQEKGDLLGNIKSQVQLGALDIYKIIAEFTYENNITELSQLEVTIIDEDEWEVELSIIKIFQAYCKLHPEIYHYHTTYLTQSSISIMFNKIIAHIKV